MFVLKKVLNGKNIMTVLFLILLFGIFIANFNSVWNIFKTEVKAVLGIGETAGILVPSEIESTYDGDFYQRMSFVNINGLAHRAMGQKLMNGAVKGANDSLFLESDVDFKFDPSKERENVNDMVSILSAAKQVGAETIYVQRPMKFIEGRDKLPYGMTVEYNMQYDYWCDTIEEQGFNVVDLRETISDDIEFYKTDHHWTVETSFSAAKNILESLEDFSNGKFTYNKQLFDKDNYDTVEYRNSFLGSKGVKTGEYYVGKDDFNVMAPQFDTDVSFKHYVDGECTIDKSGAFENAFVDKSLLEDQGYYNKYNACIYGGYVESVIENHLGGNGKKVLLISDSFARPMVMYFSLAFSETRYLDPQEGRYNESYVEYIEEFQPDVVVVMYTGAFEEV